MATVMTNKRITPSYHRWHFNVARKN